MLWFNNVKGYGYIKRDDKEEDIYVHFSAVQNSGIDSLKEAEQITFEVEYLDKKLSAINLQKTDEDVSHLHLKLIK